MMKINTKLSTLISMTLSAIFMGIIVFCAVLVPKISRTIVRVAVTLNNSRVADGINPYIILYGAYIVLAIAAIADILLFILLLRVRRNQIFTDKSVALIRAISWCCIFIGLVFFGIGFFFETSAFIGIAALFVGLCIRVVKNVIEEATIIKSENDFTV